MHYLALGLSLLASLGQASAVAPKGIDVSGYQPNVNWASVKSHNISFAYIKATESTTYRNPYFSQQYAGATNHSIIRGAYHFAQPSKSSGTAQANYFLKHGGGWSADGRTLPGALDLEAGCHGLSHAHMVSWLHDFSNTYHSKTKRYPVFYMSASWWGECTGGSKAFGKQNPLWIADWASKVGSIPAGWEFYTFWQYNNHSSTVPGDVDEFNGSLTNLKKFAKGS